MVATILLSLALLITRCSAFLSVSCLRRSWVASSIPKRQCYFPTKVKNNNWNLETSSASNNELESQLTLPLLSARLKEELEELLQKDALLQEETAKLILFHTRLNNLPINRTCVGRSTIAANAGLGLFATIDGQQGDLLTCYPGDALVHIPDDCDSDDDWTIFWGDHVPEDISSTEIDNDLLVGYMLHAKRDYGILGLPELDTGPAYLGNFANDGCAEMPLTTSSLSQYVLESNAKANAMHQDLDGCHMVTVATRDIVKGEEIVVTYGPNYWKAQPLFQTDDDYVVQDNKRPSSSGPGLGFG